MGKKPKEGSDLVRHFSFPDQIKVIITGSFFPYVFEVAADIISGEGRVASESPNRDIFLSGVTREEGPGNNVLNLLGKVKGKMTEVPTAIRENITNGDV